MAMGLLIRHWDPTAWVDGFREALGDELYVYPDMPAQEEITFVAAWRPDPGMLAHYPGLRYLQCLGAGVDQLVGRDDLLEAVVISRIVDPDLTADMTEHLMAILLSDMKHLSSYVHDSEEQRWSPRPYRRWRDVTIGILGMGELGLYAAGALAQMGATVLGWSRSAKHIAEVSSLTGEDGLLSLLESSDYVINLLPLTPATQGILSERLFSQMLPGTALINVGRGAHVDEDDLLAALDSGNLRAAYLDVFGQEPLPVDHPFWSHPSIWVTPHVASRSNPETVIAQVVANYRRAQRSESLKHTVDLRAGY